MIAIISNLDATGLLVGIAVLLLAAAIAGMLLWWFGGKDA